MMTIDFGVEDSSDSHDVMDEGRHLEMNSIFQRKKVATFSISGENQVGPLQCGMPVGTNRPDGSSIWKDENSRLIACRVVLLSLPPATGNKR